MPERAPQATSALVKILVKIDIQLKPPRFTELKEDLIDVRALLAIKHQNLAHIQWRLRALVNFWRPRVSHFLQPMPRHQLFDVLFHIRRNLYINALPTINKDFHVRLVRLGARTD